MIPAKYIKNPYALFRSECCKADIQMGLFGDEKPIRPKRTPEEQAIYRRIYSRNYNRAYRAKQKAARDCNHKAAKTNSTKIITA